MILTPGLRKFGLTAHITFSVGWFGAVTGFLVLAIAGMISQKPQMVTANYLTMELVGWLVIIPFCLATLLTGLVQSLGTEWGLFKHYWVLVKFLLTIVATIVLFLHMQPISYLADIASKKVLSNSELRGLRIQLIADAGAALLVLLFAIALSVYKPWGRIRYGQRNRQQSKMRVVVAEQTQRKSWVLYIVIGLIFLVLLLFTLLHISENGLVHH